MWQINKYNTIQYNDVCITLTLPSAATATVEGKMSKSLKKVLKKIVAKDIHQELAVADAKLGGVIKVRQSAEMKVQN